MSQVGRPTRRTVARGAAWAIPVASIAAAAPRAAASSSDTNSGHGLDPNTGVYDNNVQSNPRAHALDSGWNASDGHYIEVSFTSSGAGAVDLTSRQDNEPELEGWKVIKATAGQVVLRWPSAVSGNNFNTQNFRWYWNGSAPKGSIKVTGYITDSDVTNFDGGTVVGP